MNAVGVLMFALDEISIFINLLMNNLLNEFAFFPSAVLPFCCDSVSFVLLFFSLSVLPTFKSHVFRRRFPGQKGVSDSLKSRYVDFVPIKVEPG